MAEGLSVELRVAQRVAAPGKSRPWLDVAFELPVGLSALVGPSGAGKSTLLSAIAGLRSVDDGRVALGASVWLDTARRIALPPEFRRVGLVFQHGALFPHLNVLDNVAYGLTGTRQERRRLAAEWLERFVATPLADRSPNTLSGGEAQRVALARALARGPALLLLDEPFAALHTELRQTVAAEVRRVVEERRIPALLVSHDLDHLATLTERTLRLVDGRLAAS